MERTLKDNIDNSSSQSRSQSNNAGSQNQQQQHSQQHQQQSRLSRSKQLQLEYKYKMMNDEIRRLKESGINSKEVTEKSKLLKKKLKQANDLSKTAFDSGSQRCIEYDAEYFFNGADVNHLVVKSLQVDSQAFDPLFFAEKLKTYIAPDTRIRDDTIDENDLKIDDFIDLGKKCSYLINSAPILNYLYGSFEPGDVVIPAKQRRVGVHNICIDPQSEAKYGSFEPCDVVFPARQRRVGVRNIFIDPQGEADKPKSKQGIDESDDLKNGKEVERVYSELNEIYTKEKAPIDFFKSIVKPDSFCDTVENIFYSAFLIKDGFLAAKESKISNNQYTAFIEPQDIEEISKCKQQQQQKQKKRRTISNVNYEEEDEDEHSNDYSEDSDDEGESSSHQSILSFSMKDWQVWISQLK